MLIAEPTNAGLQPLQLVVDRNSGTSIPYAIPPCCGIPPSSFTDINGVVHDDYSLLGPPMVNSDGSAYVDFQSRQIAYPPVVTSAVLYLLKIAPDNSFTTIQLMSNSQLNSPPRFPEPMDSSLLPGPVIPDGQGGVVATWAISPSNLPQPPPVPPWHYIQAAQVVSGTVTANYDLPFTPKQPVFENLTLALGEGNTSFVTDGRDPDNGPQIVSFDLTSGAVNWNYQAATQSTLAVMASISDGSLAINDSQTGIVQLSTNGSASQVTGSLGSVAQYSWGGNWYVQGSQAASELMLPLDVDPAGIWATPSGNASQNGGPDALCECLLQSTSTTGASQPAPAEAGGAFQPPTIATCPVICNLPPPVFPATSCTTLTGNGPTYLILVGDAGLPPHNVKQGFNLAAQQNANDLQANANKVIVCRVSSAQDFNQALTTNGFIGGGVIYFGHSGPYLYSSNPRIVLSILAIGQAAGGDTNLSYSNINEICPSGCGSILASNITLAINGCMAGVPVAGNPSDNTGISATPIAKVLARQLGIRVTGYMVGTYFSLKDATNATSNNWTGEPNPLPTSTPMYLIPEGTHGHKKPPTAFCAVGSCPN